MNIQLITSEVPVARSPMKIGGGGLGAGAGGPRGGNRMMRGGQRGRSTYIKKFY